MTKLISQRLLLAFITLFLTSILVFAGTEILPGDVATALLGQSASAETLEAMRQSLGLHEAVPMRYWHWLVSVLSGDFGLSLANRRRIGPELWVRFGNTFFLAGVAAAIAVPLSLLLGIVTAAWRNSWLDKTINVLGLIAISLPEFFIAYLLLLLFAVQLDLFPSLSNVSPGMPLGERLWTIVLPAVTLILAVLAYIMRMTRTAILSVMAYPYMEMALLKGVPRWRRVIFHALPNAFAPIIQVVSFNLAYMVAGVVLVEVVFVYPGIGQFLVDAVARRDVTVVQACALVFSGTYIGLNFLADIAVIIANPRLRLPR
jgi:peptide/nickel transport system permease protein